MYNSYYGWDWVIVMMPILTLAVLFALAAAHIASLNSKHPSHGTGASYANWVCRGHKGVQNFTTYSATCKDGWAVQQ